MSISPIIRDVFGHFQNLNLLALLFDLHQDHTARQAWSSGSLLCPVAHGLPAGQQVQQLAVLGQIAELGRGCDFAARCLGADPAAVLRFVRSWDADAFSRDWLFHQLFELWEERLADAEAVQELLQSGQTIPASLGWQTRVSALPQVGRQECLPYPSRPDTLVWPWATGSQMRTSPSVSVL